MNTRHTHLRSALGALMAAALAVLPAAAGAPRAPEQKLDSAWLMMGRRTALTIEMTADRSTPPGTLDIDKRALPPQIEIAAPGVTDTTDPGNGRYQLRRRILLQAFDSGVYTLPPAIYVSGRDTARSAALALKVIPVAVDTLADIHPYAPTADARLRLIDRLPDWLVDYGLWILLAIAAIAFAIAFAVRRHRRRATAATTPAAPPVPPYEAAMAQLEQLRERHLCEQGQEREFYTRLTEILRIYLRDRFGINALEMTSTEILAALDRDDATRTARPRMREILHMADFVKFAKVRPLPADNTATFRRALDFVENTRPQPVPDPDETSRK